MGRPYSMDLRERVVEAVEKDGLSRRRAAAHFGVSYSVAIGWLKRFGETLITAAPDDAVRATLAKTAGSAATAASS